MKLNIVTNIRFFTVEQAILMKEYGFVMKLCNCTPSRPYKKLQDASIEFVELPEVVSRFKQIGLRSNIIDADVIELVR